MRFDAIVHAPTLRAGTRLNIAEADQTEGTSPDRLEVGSEVRLRFGVCCPDLSFGTVTEYTALPETVVLAIGTESWTLSRGEGGGITTPGLLSEDWYVSGAPPARDVV
jgi:hypothetical protein